MVNKIKRIIGCLNFIPLLAIKYPHNIVITIFIGKEISIIFKIFTNPLRTKGSLKTIVYAVAVNSFGHKNNPFALKSSVVVVKDAATTYHIGYKVTKPITIKMV